MSGLYGVIKEIAADSVAVSGVAGSIVYALEDLASPDLKQSIVCWFRGIKAQSSEDQNNRWLSEFSYLKHALVTFIIFEALLLIFYLYPVLFGEGGVINLLSDSSAPIIDVEALDAEAKRVVSEWVDYFYTFNIVGKIIAPIFVFAIFLVVPTYLSIVSTIFAINTISSRGSFWGLLATFLGELLLKIALLLAYFTMVCTSFDLLLRSAGFTASFGFWSNYFLEAVAFESDLISVQALFYTVLYPSSVYVVILFYQFLAVFANQFVGFKNLLMKFDFENRPFKVLGILSTAITFVLSCAIISILVAISA